MIMALTVKPFVQETHEKALGTVQAFGANVERFGDITTSHRKLAMGRTVQIVATVAFVALAATAYATAHKYAALGSLAVALLVGAFGSRTKLVATSDFNNFSNDCNTLVEHVTNAFASKATFMIDQVNTKTNGWNAGWDTRLATDYETPDTTKHLDATKISPDQTEFRKVHKALVAALSALKIDLDAVKAVNSELHSVVEKVSRAKDLLICGQSPVVAKATYIKYNADGTATSWLSEAPVAKA